MAGWYLSEQAREALRTALVWPVAGGRPGPRTPCWSRSWGSGTTGTPADPPCCAPAG